MNDRIILRPDVLQNPSILDVAVLEVLMLWPTDRARRERVLKSIVIKHVTDKKGWAAPASSLEVSDLVRLVQDAPRLEEFGEAAKDAMRRGVIAGALLTDVVGLTSMKSSNANLSRLKKRYAEAFTKKLRIRMSEKTIDNDVWREYRSVAPYWAAWLWLYVPCDRFPCDPNGLETFLATADAFRIAGESTRTHQSPSPILRVGETFVPDLSISLPHIDLEFEEATPEAKGVDIRRRRAEAIRRRVAKTLNEQDNT